MSHQYIENLKSSHFKIIQHAASQIAGRRAKKHAPDFRIDRSRQHRARQSPYKDLADSTQRQVASWIKEDRHEGGSLFEAFGDAVGVLHHHRATRQGGGLFDTIGAHAKKINGALGNLAETARVNIDVGADDFLHRVGLRQEKKYQDDSVSKNFRDHAVLHKDAYLSVNDRKGTDRFEYMKEKSTGKYATYKDKESGKIVVGFRGTSPAQALTNNDLVEDAHIAAGTVKDMSEYEDYINHIQGLVKEHGSGNVSLSGYSLGGGKVLELMQDKRIRSDMGQAHALAPGITALDDKLKQKATDHKISMFYHHNDAVANSMLEHSGSNHTVHYSESNPINSHMLLDRIANAKVGD